VLPNHDMVQQFDFQQLARLSQPLRRAHILTIYMEKTEEIGKTAGRGGMSVARLLR
jgi:hypothetical protein